MEQNRPEKTARALENEQKMRRSCIMCIITFGTHLCKIKKLVDYSLQFHHSTEIVCAYVDCREFSARKPFHNLIYFHIKFVIAELTSLYRADRNRIFRTI